MIGELLIILALVLLNGVLSGTEIATISVRRTRLRELIEKGSGAAQAVERLRGDPERFLATVQIGITVIGAAAGAFGGATIANRLAPLLARVPWLERSASELAFALVVGGVSYLSLVLGELVPKSLALRASEPYALFVARPMLALAWVTRPLVWFLTASSNVVLRLFGDSTSFTEARLSSEEISQMVEEASNAGTVDPRAGAMAQRAFELTELTAGEVMVPRPQVIALSRDAEEDEIRRVLLEEGYSRIPVYGESMDDVIGYVSVKDVVALAWERELIVLADLLRPAYFVPETMRALDLLQELQRRRLHMAIVVDEQGGLAGICTIEDLVEELVGEIFSEHDEAPPEQFRREADGALVVPGDLAVRDLNRAADLDLNEEGDWTTVAGLCIALAGRIPEKGARIATEDGYVIEVLDANPRRVKLVRVRPPKPESPAAVE